VRDHVHRVPDQDQRQESRDDGYGDAATADAPDGTWPARPRGTVFHNQCLAPKV
jgi:hypothetical protein